MSRDATLESQPMKMRPTFPAISEGVESRIIFEALRQMKCVDERVHFSFVFVVYNAFKSAIPAAEMSDYNCIQVGANVADIRPLRYK